MATSFKKKIFLLVFCLASITQGMYSTYFVSILTTIERIYQIQSKTAGAILSATEIGQILGSLFIAYYGGRGNKPKWISVCMTLSAFAALISITPHFILLATNNDTNINQQQATASAAAILQASSSSLSLHSPYLTSDLSSSGSSSSGSINDDSGTTGDQRVRNITAQLAATAVGGGHAHAKVGLLPSFDQLCRIGNYTSSGGGGSNSTALNTTITRPIIGESISKTGADSSTIAYNPGADFPVALVISIFSICLLAIGFGSTAITTLGIPFIDDIISREESPFYLGLTIGLRIFGPALGFLLGSFCIRLNANSLLGGYTEAVEGPLANQRFNDGTEIGAWWLGLVIISLPLLVLAIPMYFLSRFITGNDGDEKDDYEDITYQAAEDHDIGGSHDFPAHVLGLTGGVGDLDVTSARTCFSSGGIDSSSREVLQLSGGGGGAGLCNTAYGQNITFVEQAILTTSECMKTVDDNEGFSRPSVRRLVVNHLNEFEEAQSGGSGIDGASRQQQACPLSCVVLQSSSPRPTQEQPRRSSTRSSVASTMSSSSTTCVGAGDQTTKNSKLKRRALHQQQRQHKGDHSHNGQSTIGDLSSSLWRLLRNKLLVLRMLSGVLHILPIAGFYTFLPKYLIEQFRISSSSASAISGLAGILFVGFGAFIGGTIIRLFNVNSRIMTRWIATSALVYALGMIILMNLDCQQNQIVHFNSLEFVSTDCSQSCQCSRATYNPVCANGTTFMSPCLAGCKGHSIADGGRVIFGECGCAPRVSSGNESLGLTVAASWMASTTGDEGRTLNQNIATQGQCLNNCDNIMWYVILFSIFTLIHASCEVGSMMFNLRCVKSDDRTLALGLITFSSSLLGTIPCSIIYGSVVDFTCVHWDTYISRSASGSLAAASATSLAEDAARGACRAYDNDSFRYYLHGLTALVMSIAFIVDCIISSRANEVDFYEGTDESKMDIRIGLKKSTETIQ